MKMLYLAEVCPLILKFKNLFSCFDNLDVDLRETVSFAESVHNLEQVETFLDKHLPDTHHFTFEDLLYSPEVLRVNILALFAELFHWFEVEKPQHLEVGQDQGILLCAHRSRVVVKCTPALSSGHLAVPFYSLFMYKHAVMSV